LLKKNQRVGQINYDAPDGQTSVPPLEEVVASWRNSFTFIKEDKDNGIEGLRSPQIGAIHAALSHWEVSSVAATIVMPTGTGKTETMISLLIVGLCNKLLILVPSDSLRTQISKKFISLGLLKTLGLVKKEILPPVVGILKRRPKTIDEVDSFFDSCNVVVSTMSIMGGLSPEIRIAIAEKCSELFLDEAHHVAAETWSNTKKAFSDKRILQFTATPFRNDSKPIKDKIIFNYPLSKAQDEGYFRQIKFLSIEEWDPEKHDQSLAEKAIERLREDIDNGYNHILMARVNSIDRAEQVIEFYNKEEDLNAILINSKVANKEEIVKVIQSLEYQILVCVDMLGEGFDLPQLKVAAFHDIKKSLPITIQLAGRFTRDSRDEKLGEASIIVNLAMTEATNELEQLYASDSDWNKILPIISQENIQEQIGLHDFIKGFNKFPDELQLQNVHPALSTVIFKTNVDGEWFPNNFKKGIQGIEELEQVYYDINTTERVLVVVTGRKSTVKWGRISDLFELTWSLYVIYWNREQQLLFINTSDNGGNYQKLANAVSFNTAELVNAEDVFKSLYGVAQMKINNVGLKSQLDKLLSFTMHSGEDIEPALSRPQLLNRIKSNIFCTGYEGGEKVSIGCSYKGRIWSKRTANLVEFIGWCDAVGTKILNQNINVDDILRGAIHLKTISSRPDLHPISINWNEELFFNENLDNVTLSKDGFIYPIYLFDLKLLNPSSEGNIQFEVKHEDFSSIYELEFFSLGTRNTFRVRNISNPFNIQIGRQVVSLTDYFYSQSPIIRFIDGSYLEGNLFAEYKYKGESYDKNKIEVWNWEGVNIQKESQKNIKRVDSIQFKVIQNLKESNYEVIFDDDNAGEIADVIAIKCDDLAKKITVELYHLKFSHGQNPGARISDLYEVCGQAQKSILWKGKGPSNMFKRMLNRTQHAKKQRIEVGSLKAINLLKEKSKKSYSTTFKIFIVQPGLSRNAVNEQQLELLAVTENHLMETYRIGFGVIASA
jgi:superfamily II DNA or RNA helicase